MTTGKKLLTTLAFLLILGGLATADALLTRGTLILPERNGADTAVTKKPGPDVVAVAQSLGLSAQETDEQFIVGNILPAGTTLSSRVLLENNDRASAIGWFESPDVKEVFTTLREHLRPSFSPDLKDLIDETQTEADKAPRDVLSFYDPAIHADRLVFVRVRDRFYEFHVTQGKEPTIDRLVNALTD